MCNTSLLENNSEFSVIILAAGYSSRMRGKLKALLPLGEFSHLLHMLIDCFKVASVEDIHIVLGYEQESMREILRGLDCCVVYNPDFDKGMFSSICAGIQSVLDKGRTKKASFILPVDAALLKSETLQTMMSLWEKWNNKNQTNNILIPCFLKQCGHPPLVGREHFFKILQYYKDSQEQERADFLNLHGLHGLRGYFASCLDINDRALFLKGHAGEFSELIKESDAGELSDVRELPKEGELSNLAQSPRFMTRHDIETLSDAEQSPKARQSPKTRQSPHIMHFISIADEGILSDIDTLEDYIKAQSFLEITENRQTASLQESLHLLQEACLPERIVKHSCKVAVGALRLGLALQREEVNPLYHVCGGLLHDICRLQKNHASVGEAYLRQMGWDTLACIVGTHTALPKNILQIMDIHLQEPVEDIALLPIESDLHNDSAWLYACICVYLADKFYSGEYFVSMKNRFLKVKERFAQVPGSLQAINEREQVAKAVCDWFYSVTKIQAEECVQVETNHELEKQLQTLCEMYALVC